MRFEERLRAAVGGLIRVKSPLNIAGAGWTREREHLCVLIKPAQNAIASAWSERMSIVGPGLRHKINVLLMGSPQVIWVSEGEIDFLTHTVS